MLPYTYGNVAIVFVKYSTPVLLIHFSWPSPDEIGCHQHDKLEKDCRVHPDF